MADTSDLAKLAQKLATDGPHKIEQTARRVRALFGGKYVIDTTQAYHVWEHPYYPQLELVLAMKRTYSVLRKTHLDRFYVPSSAITKDSNFTKNSSVPSTSDKVHFATLSAGGKRTERVLVFNTKELKDLVKVDFASMDQWFEEDVPIYQHPKDPYKRIDILASTRSIKVALDGLTLASTDHPLLLLETTLRTRYYLPPTSVNWEALSKSPAETYCPYKGRANYYNVTVNGKEYKDLVWCYQYPTAESAAIVGHLCFYNEKVDIWVDGVKEER